MDFRGEFSPAALRKKTLHLEQSLMCRFVCACCSGIHNYAQKLLRSSTFSPCDIYAHIIGPSHDVVTLS